MTIITNFTSSLTSNLTPPLPSAGIENPHTDGLQFQGATFQSGKLKSELVTTGGGCATSALLDYSGNGRDQVQSAGSKQPIFTSDFLNGHPVLKFDASSGQILEASVSFTIRTVFIVGIFETGAPTILSGLLGEKDGAQFAIRIHQTIPPLKFRGNTATDASDFTNGAGEMRIDGAVAENIVFDTPFILRAERASGASFIPTISESAAARFWKGSVGEVLMYDDALITGETESVEGYLSEKWGVALS